MNTRQQTSFHTAFGHVGLTWQGDALVEIRLPGPSGPKPTQKPVPDWLKPLADEIRRYFSGENVEFHLPKIHRDTAPPFFMAVYERIAQIPRGETMSYGAVAAACGSPAASRAVGQAMARNPLPLVFPCHRVLAAGGCIGGFGGGITDERLMLKRRMLELEGVVLD